MKQIILILKQDDGAGLAEYALLLLLIALACIAAIGALGLSLNSFFDAATGMLF